MSNSSAHGTISRVLGRGVCLFLGPQLVKQNLPSGSYQMAQEAFLFF